MYSLGVLVYTMLVGKNPFRGKTAAESSHRQQTVVPPAPADVAPTILPGLSDLTMQMLSKKAQDRPTSDEVLRWFADRQDSLHDSRPNPR